MSLQTLGYTRKRNTVRGYAKHLIIEHLRTSHGKHRGTRALTTCRAGRWSTLLRAMEHAPPGDEACCSGRRGWQCEQERQQEGADVYAFRNENGARMLIGAQWA